MYGFTTIKMNKLELIQLYEHMLNAEQNMQGPKRIYTVWIQIWHWDIGRTKLQIHTWVVKVFEENKGVVTLEVRTVFLRHWEEVRLGTRGELLGGQPCCAP